MPDMEETIRELQDALIVLAEIERRQTTMLGERAEHPRKHEQRLALLEAESAEFRRRTDQNLAEITDKLNGLIGYVGGIDPPPPR